MFEFIVMIMVGILFIVIGVLNTHGNVSMLHSYHRERVSEEDRLPFGRMVGAGMIILGSGIAVSGILMIGFNKLLTFIGTAVLAVSFCLGLGLAFYAMIKYNKGIF